MVAGMIMDVERDYNRLPPIPTVQRFNRSTFNK
jgi:hypothetical protein